MLVSCSSDCTAKVWYLDAATNHTQRNHGPFATPQLVGLPYCTVLHHPTYVYCCKLYPNASLARIAAAQQEPGTCTNACEDALLLVTGCADGLLYFWSLNADRDPLLAPDGAEPLLRQPGGLALQANGTAACVNALLWDVVAPSQLPDASRHHASGYTPDSQKEAALHASAAKRSLGGEVCSTTHSATHEHSAPDAVGNGRELPLQSSDQVGSAKQSRRHRNALFSGAAHCCKLLIFAKPDEADNAGAATGHTGCRMQAHATSHTSVGRRVLSTNQNS